MENTEGEVDRVKFISTILKNIDTELFSYVNPISLSFINNTWNKKYKYQVNWYIPHVPAIMIADRG